MLLEGLKLLGLGMGIVFLFLGLLLWTISALGRLLAAATQRELELERADARPTRTAQTNSQQKQIIAAIGTAVAMYRLGKATRIAQGKSM